MSVRPSSRRAQAALEYLTTYGFAFLALLLALGVLNYLGVFNAANLRQSGCSFPQGFACNDYIINTANPGNGSTGPYLRLALTNEYGANITVVASNLTLKSGFVTTNCALNETTNWIAGTNRTLWCPVPSTAYAPGQRIDGAVAVRFQQTAGIYQHRIIGTWSVNAQ